MLNVRQSIRGKAANAALAEAVLELLIDSTAVAEVFLDEAELETALRETRPAP